VLETPATRYNSKKDTDIVIKAKQSTSKFLFALHDDPDIRAGAFVDEFCKGGMIDRRDWFEREE
jgi:hypothetical protein